MGRSGTANAPPAPTLDAGAPKVRLSVTGAANVASPDVAQPVMLIGSRRDCDLPVQHGDVSQVHCAVVNTGRDIIVADLCSRTGTFVNDQRVTVATLRAGDRLRIGDLSVDVAVSDDRQARAAADEDPTRLATPMRLSGAGVKVELDSLPALIGRRGACPVVIDTPDVSLAHALLLTIAGTPAVFDLGSRSGSYVNGRRATLAWLNDGDELSIGGVKLQTSWTGVSTRPVDAVVAAPPIAGAVALPSALADAPLNPNDDLDTVLAALQNHLWALRSKLLERSMSLEQREAALTSRADQIAAEAARFTSRESEIAAREQDLARRIRELADRETVTAETARRIEQFKSALNDASQRLTGLGMGARRAAEAPLVDRPLFDAVNALSDSNRRPSGN